MCVGEEKYVYNDTASVAFGTLDTSEKGSGTAYDYLFLGDPTDPEDTVKYGGSAEDFTVLDVAGKIVLISRGGGVNFADKQKYAMNAGAAGAIIYNNEAGTINMSLSGKLPCVSMRKDQMESILAQSVQDAAGELHRQHGGCQRCGNGFGGNRRRHYHELLQLVGRAWESDAEAGDYSPWRQHLFHTGRRPIWSHERHLYGLPPARQVWRLWWRSTSTKIIWTSRRD